jgi:DNA-binding NarL/FixJ family response regulator
MTQDAFGKSVTVKLTSNQIEALRALANGLSMKEYAAQSGTNFHTVHSRLKTAYKRLKARGSNNAVAIAVKSRIIWS